MSPPWSRPLEIDRLADGGADVDFAVPLAELAGLRPLRPVLGGEVHGRVRFSRERGFAVARLAGEGTAQLECQRCLRPLIIPLHLDVRVALIESEARAAAVPEEFEPVLAAGGRTSIGELVTEELLLSLPIVALHEGAACPGEAQPPEPTAAETHRPFAQLKDLLKR